MSLAYHARMLFLVDGYNVTLADPATRLLEIDEQRDRLVARLRARGGQLLGAGRIVVVFDGAQGTGITAATLAPVDVRFSRGEQADDLVVRLATGAQEKVCLVSSDAALAARVRAAASRGVEVRGREVVFEAAGRGDRKRRRRRALDAGSLGVPPGGRGITRELEKLWLDEEDEG
ncbi:MAG: NYN domain-containing protein [Anaerosomatales bacterium]|nr:NYN domain-containing protein [Anaerosomatales bacterium]MDT8434147.1 NYN domain-containing protein [Anaerosomatales bacterium]